MSQYEPVGRYRLLVACEVALHERFGFRKVAHYSEQGRKFGRYWDVAWFEKPL